MPKATLLVIAASAALAASCSPAVSVRPLDESGNCVVDSRVEGEWISLDSDSLDQAHPTTRWKVAVRSGRYDVEMITIPRHESAEPETDRYSACLVGHEGALFFDAKIWETIAGNRTIVSDNWPLGLVPVHVIGRLRVEQDYLVLDFLDSHWVHQKTSASFHESATLSRYTDVSIITAPSSEVLEFLARQVDDPDSTLRMYLCRPDADCVRHTLEDALSHAPANLTEKDLLDMLVALSRHHLRAGRFREALPSLRRAAALKPEDSTLRNGPANALLLDRDYDGARQEYSSILATHPDATGVQEGIAWSYFLEGRFDEASRAFLSLVDSADRESIEPVLLAYLALKRSGRDSEATRLLAGESARLPRAPVDEQLLLLLFMERIDIFPYEVSGSPEDQSKAHFFAAERLLALGQDDAARHDFWESVTLGHKDSIYVAAATIELERLDASSVR